MGVKDELNKFIAENGGNERDALNVALARLSFSDARIGGYQLTIENDAKDKDALRAENKRLISELRTSVADYMQSEGCSCCRHAEAHEEHTKKLAELLKVPQYDDGSGYNFYKFRSSALEVNHE